MGILIRTWKTTVIPEGATVLRQTAHWTAKGKKRTAKMTPDGRVRIQSTTWTAQFRDENGKVCRISTKTSNRSVAEKILARYESEVDRIKAGLTSRQEMHTAKIRQTGLSDVLDQYKTKMIAAGCTRKHLTGTLQKLSTILNDCGIELLSQLERGRFERWIAGEIQRKTRSARTINSYLSAVKSFTVYAVESNLLSADPVKSIRKLNEQVDRRKVRRALTEDEVRKLLDTAAAGIYRKKFYADERHLIYRLMLGTGLRSTELSLLTPAQFDFVHNRLRISAAKTKNRKDDILPVRPALVLSVKEWIEKNGIQPAERIFRYNAASIRRSLYADLKRAGIARETPDGRSVDVHALRRTFGTMLAKAGVPLTTVQRLMRHSTPELTAKLYIDVEPIDMLQAVSKLPDF
ncbi:MAG: site-specific integrase [Planctomycetaceae bacterium]|jgi:integrase|nr:site-specific integrase [Planctomycetaceae bacterium]